MSRKTTRTMRRGALAIALGLCIAGGVQAQSNTAGAISGRAEDIDYVDMRYSNGFAIGWKHGGVARSDEPKPRPVTPAAHFTA